MKRTAATLLLMLAPFSLQAQNPTTPIERAYAMAESGAIKPNTRYVLSGVDDDKCTRLDLAVYWDKVIKNDRIVLVCYQGENVEDPNIFFEKFVKIEHGQYGQANKIVERDTATKKLTERLDLDIYYPQPSQGLPVETVYGEDIKKTQGPERLNKLLGLFISEINKAKPAK